ncbi:hypothetical protein Vretifemale_10955, partial [Volvox reticuliferus]
HGNDSNRRGASHLSVARSFIAGSSDTLGSASASGTGASLGGRGRDGVGLGVAASDNSRKSGASDGMGVMQRAGPECVTSAMTRVPTFISVDTGTPHGDSPPSSSQSPEQQQEDGPQRPANSHHHDHHQQQQQQQYHQSLNFQPGNPTSLSPQHLPQLYIPRVGVSSRGSPSSHHPNVSSTPVSPAGRALMRLGSSLRSAAAAAATVTISRRRSSVG